MANPNFLTDADLWRRMGGQDKLTQLLDPERTGAEHHHVGNGAAGCV